VTKPSVTVLVPVYNGARHLPELFKALRAQTLDRAAWELIVVDDRSTDGTADLVAAEPWARVVGAPTRGGSYRARNIGLASARGDLVAFTDADCIPDPEWLERGLAAFTDGAELDLLAGAVEIPLSARPSAAALVDAARCMDQERYATTLGFGITANLWARRAVLEAVGGFNNSILSGGDAEFCHRATANGARLAYRADVVVGHPPRDRSTEVLRKSWRLGYGAAQRRFHADGPLRDGPLHCLRPGAYLPTGGTEGADRVARRRGAPLPRRELARLAIASYFLMKLPVTLGSLAGLVDELSGRKGPIRIQ
jgi:glycosyltransferase involved in cell wall biosynthesis